MKPAHRIAVLLISLIWSACVALGSEPEKNSGVTVTLFDSNGLSADSATDHILEIILFKEHNHIHLKVSNTSGQPLILWRPYCPQGDMALSIEFRESAAPDKIYRAFARTDFFYHAGMGIPKTFTLAPRNDLIVNVDFLSEWNLPFSMKATETREFEARAVYHSERLSDKEFKRYSGKEMEELYGSKDLAERMLETKKMDGVWTGIATSDWQKVRVFNRTGTTVETR